MQPIAAILASDWFPLAVIALLLLEGGALVAWKRRWRGFGSFLGAGIALMGAMYFHPGRTAATSLGFMLTMLAAFAFHVLHVVELSREDR